MSVTCPVCKNESTFARLYSRMFVCVCVRVSLCDCVHACVCAQVCTVKCDIFTIPHLYVSYIFFWLLQPDCLLNANAFGCRLALAPPGYSLQMKSFVPK